MFSLRLLLAALTALMSASPALSAGATCKNDPLRAIAIQVPPQPDPPICCLRPLQPLEPVDDNALPSFEEWKVKQSAGQGQPKMKDHDTFNRSAQASPTEGSGNDINGSEVVTVVVSETAVPGSSLEVGDTIKFNPSVTVSAHFRVPLTDRFNYANLDCSARVHLSHRSAKSSSSILSSKRDRYMLSPCNPPNKERQFVVVELCEDIRIDTVQLANFEFFSGVFKDFRVSVAKTYTTDEEGWTTAGTYRAKNIRGVQSFHPPTSLRDFYRYIRIDFLSHYGNEFYCPVSLLRVYGLTHLEEWKWETWEAESKAKLDESAKADAQSLATPARIDADLMAEPKPSFEGIIDGDGISTTTTNQAIENVPSITSTSTLDVSTTDSSLAAVLSVSSDIGLVKLSVSENGTTENLSLTPNIVETPKDTPRSSTLTPEISVTTSVSLTSATRVHTSIAMDSSSVSSPSIVQVSASPSSHVTESNSDPPSVTRTASPSSGSHSSLSISSPSPIAATTVTTVATTSLATSTTVSMHVAPPPAAVPTGGESIYRTIMNRLTALEANHTLYSRYVEQQTSAVREMLRRLGEDVGRLEGIGRAQAQMYQRTVHDWEKRQHRLQMEYGELMSRVEYLSDEIVLEKRLGVAQLCLLLAVLVFMGLTRGSRGESFMEHAPAQLNRSMREWSKRHLSFSGDWTNRFKSKSRSRSVSRDAVKQRPRPLKPLQIPNIDGGSKEFSSKDSSKEVFRSKHSTAAQSDAVFPTRQIDLLSHSPSQRTTRGRHHHHTRPATPTSAFRTPSVVQRSSSQNVVLAPYGHGPGSAIHTPAPRSVRRWARTAHLHEVKSNSRSRSPRTPRREVVQGHQNDGAELFSARATVPPLLEPLVKREWDEKGTEQVDCVPPKIKDGEGDSWVDTDLDVGESEEEVQWEHNADAGRASLTLVSSKEH